MSVKNFARISLSGLFGITFLAKEQGKRRKMQGFFSLRKEPLQSLKRKGKRTKKQGESDNEKNKEIDKTRIGGSGYPSFPCLSGPGKQPKKQGFVIPTEPPRLLNKKRGKCQKRKSSQRRKARNYPPKKTTNEKNPRVRKIRVRNSGAGNGCANCMDTWKKCLLSAGKPPCP